MPYLLCSFNLLGIYVSGPVVGAGYTDLDQPYWVLPGGALNPIGRGTPADYPGEMRFELRLEEWKGGG